MRDGKDVVDDDDDIVLHGLGYGDSIRLPGTYHTSAHFQATATTTSWWCVPYVILASFERRDTEHGDVVDGRMRGTFNRLFYYAEHHTHTPTHGHTDGKSQDKAAP